MKKFFNKLTKISAVAAVCMFVFFVSTTNTLAYKNPGKPTGFVNDYANILDQGSKQKLESDLTNLQKQTGIEFSVVTIKNLDGDTVENYANQLFNEWGIGGTGNRGLLLLISMEDRKTRFEVGYGLEGTLPDLLTSKIQQNYLLPSFKQGDYVGGIQNTVATVIGILDGDVSASEIQGTQKNSSYDGIWFFLIYLIFPMFVFILQFLIYSMARSKAFWLGGAVFGGLAFTFSEWSFSPFPIIVIGISILGTLFGLLVDYRLSKKGTNVTSFTEFLKKNKSGRHSAIFFGGSSGGGGSSFGGFSGGSSGGGGSSGSW